MNVGLLNQICIVLFDHRLLFLR